MNVIRQSSAREIIEDHAKEIQLKKTTTATPSKKVINFRGEYRDNFEREVVKVPIHLLRYRKDNGRILSDVIGYEKSTALLDETKDEAQKQLQKFLENKDPVKKSDLVKSITHAGQREPAIITADGFLVDGNRRKMALSLLDGEEFEYMKVVILPGKGDPGGPPTLLEIEQLENRYQLHSDGKSEYYGFDLALSIRRKIETGFSLRDQILDDPEHVGKTEKEIKKAIKKYEKEYLNPINCVDRYLNQFHQEERYDLISKGHGDKKGCWQAFYDYSNAYSASFSNQNYLNKNNIEEDEIGDIQTAAFNIIRLRTVPEKELYKVMRELPKYCSNKESKEHIIEISQNVKPDLPLDERIDENGGHLPPETIEAKWKAENKGPIINSLKKAIKCHESGREKATPLALLEAAYKKLTHPNMKIESLHASDYKKARDQAAKIGKKVKEIESEIYNQKKNSKSANKKK